MNIKEYKHLQVDPDPAGSTNSPSQKARWQRQHTQLLKAKRYGTTRLWYKRRQVLD